MNAAGNEPPTPLLNKRCWDCPFDARLSVRQRTELLDDYDLETHRFEDGREMYCHLSGSGGGPGGERELHRCRGFYNIAERHRREGAV